MSDAAAEADDPAYELALNQRRLAFVSAQASGLRWQIVAMSLIVAAVVWTSVPAWVVLGWFVAIVVVREWRALRLEALVRDQAQPMAQRLRALLRWNIVLGAVTGAAAVFMVWLDLAYSAVLTMIMVSLAAGAVSTSAPVLKAYVGYAAAIFLPLAAFWLLQATWLSTAVAVLIVMFFGVQYRFAKNNATIFDESFRIRRENEALAQRLAAEQAALARARDAAQAANEAKTRFLAAASHDLRQPLHALTLHASLLARDPHAPDAAQIAQDISTSIDALAGLLDSLLDISKLDAGVVVADKRPIRLQRLIANLVRAHQAQAEAKGLSLRFECPPHVVVQTDPLLLERVLRNLLDNAVKYTAQGEVLLLVQAQVNHRVRIAVRDTGAGIPRQAQEQVFEEFFQLTGAARDGSRGLGLGLAIVRRLTGLLDLPLTLSSEPGQGTEVAFEMDCVHGGQEDAPRVLPPVAELAGKRVLVVDDEHAVRHAMQRILDRMGCTSFEAGNMQDALDHAERGALHLVVADYRLGNGEDGISLIRRLREATPGLPALLISGDTDPERLVEAERSGIPLLHKPVTVDRLQAAMHEVMATAGATGA